mgnify:FL=1
MHKRTKALSIPKRVKDAVWKRDGGCCVLCGSPRAHPNAHYISRAQGGLGIERNIVTLCINCHRRYDQTADRAEIRLDLREYLESRYPDWDESQLIYKKGG